MNVIHLMQDSYLPDLTGNSIALECFRKAIAREHENVIFIWNKNQREQFEKVEGVPVYNPKGSRKDIKSMLDHTIKEREIDLLIAHSFREEGHISVLKTTNVPKVLIAHYDYREQMKEIHKIFDLIVSFQKPQINKYKKMGVPKDKLLFSPPPRDIGLFRPLNLEKESRSILYVGRLIEAKGIHKIVPYLKDLDANLTCIGPPIEDEEYKTRLEDLIKKERVENRISLRGIVSRDQLLREYNKHSAFVLLSTSDCYSLVLQEAILTGLPAVALENHGHYNWTEGHIFIENSIEMCVHRLKQILDGKCTLKYDEEFVKILSLEKNAPRLNHELEELVRDTEGFEWREEWS